MISGYGSLTKPKLGVMLNPLHPLSRGLVGYWLFNEGAGSRANDISGHSNHGMLKDMSPNAQNSGWGGSKFGGGLNFDGVDDYVDCGNNKSMDISSASEGLTIELYLKPVSLPVETSILSKGSVGCNNYNFFIVGGYLALLSSAECTWNNKGANSVVSIGIQQHVAVTWDSVSLDVKYYIDGILKDNIANWNIGSTNVDSLQIGHQQFGDPGWLNSNVEYMRIYNRPISAFEVKQLCEDPFCNLLRVPVRHVSVAAVWELVTTIAASTVTSTPSMAVLRELIATIDTQTGTVATMGVLRELIASIDTITSLSDIELLVGVLRELSVIIAVATSTSASDLNVVRGMDAAIASTTSMSDADLSVLRELASTVAVVTLTSTIDLLVETLRELSATIATVTSTSTPEMKVLRELEAIIEATTLLSDIELLTEQLRELVTTIATVTSTSTPEMKVLRELEAIIEATTLLSDIELLTEQLRELVTTIATVTSTSTPEMKVLRELEAIIEATTALSAIELAISVWLTSNPTITRLKSEGWFE